eukprot:3685263-Amphidinium_carterae.1
MERGRQLSTSVFPLERWTCEVRFADLAGSERAKKSGTVGERFKEQCAVVHTSYHQTHAVVIAFPRKERSIARRKVLETRVLIFLASSWGVAGK